MKHRMVIATLSLIGFFVAAYLWLWELGFLGTIACGTGACETVQLSAYAEIFGQPVAVYGVAGYALLLVISLVGIQPRWLERAQATVALAVCSGIGVVFTAYLTYLEAFVIHAWCRWCLVSAAIITLIFVTALVGWRAMSRAKPSPS